MALRPGQKLRRREPAAGNDPWNEVVVGGFFDMGDGGYEVVLSPAVGFASPVTASADSVLNVYTLDTEPPARIDPAPWETPEAEIQEVKP